MTQFQQTVNIFNALGIVGDIAMNDPGQRALAANVNSNGAALNLFGNYFTLSSPSTAEPTNAAPNGATVQAGGTGALGGILCNLKQNPLYGTSGVGGALNPSNALPDNQVGQLLQRGFVFVNLPGPANVGDLVTYDTGTGNLNSVPAVTTFSGYIVAGGSAGTPDVLHVTAVTSGGALQIGQIISGTGVYGGTTIMTANSEHGGVGTYNLSTINQQTVFSSGTPGTMTTGSLPAPAFAGTGYITTSAGVDTLTVSTVTSGEVALGMQLVGTGILANTVITAFGSGAGNTGTYTLNTSGQTVFSSGSPGAITGPTELFVPRASVYLYQADTAGGNAIIKLDN